MWRANFSWNIIWFCSRLCGVEFWILRQPRLGSELRYWWFYFYKALYSVIPWPTWNSTQVRTSIVVCFCYLRTDFHLVAKRTHKFTLEYTQVLLLRALRFSIEKNNKTCKQCLALTCSQIWSPSKWTQVIASVRKSWPNGDSRRNFCQAFITILTNNTTPKCTASSRKLFNSVNSKILCGVGPVGMFAYTDHAAFSKLNNINILHK